MKQFMVATVAFVVFTTSVSLVEAINISVAEVQNGFARVEGGKAASNAIISWEGSNVSVTNKNGGFKFSGLIPSDCIGRLNDGLTTIDVALANCTSTREPTARVLVTGQTTCWATAGASIPCTNTSQDGDLQKGVARSYTDNADGTVTDNVTGLMWEGLCDGVECPIVNDKDTIYTWADAFAVKIATLNTEPCFAGYCDWRLPNINELHTLAYYDRSSPAIHPAFTITQSGYYWSSTTYLIFREGAWGLDFSFAGDLHASNKANSHYVRAVRGGS